VLPGAQEVGGGAEEGDGGEGQEEGAPGGGVGRGYVQLGGRADPHCLGLGRRASRPEPGLELEECSVLSVLSSLAWSVCSVGH
jgi:hypothetical protein